jgi:hypothetical protein
MAAVIGRKAPPFRFWRRSRRPCRSLRSDCSQWCSWAAASATRTTNSNLSLLRMKSGLSHPQPAFFVSAHPQFPPIPRTSNAERSPKETVGQPGRPAAIKNCRCVFRGRQMRGFPYCSVDSMTLSSWQVTRKLRPRRARRPRLTGFCRRIASLAARTPVDSEGSQGPDRS